MGKLLSLNLLGELAAGDEIVFHFLECVQHGLATGSCIGAVLRLVLLDGSAPGAKSRTKSPMQRRRATIRALSSATVRSAAAMSGRRFPIQELQGLAMTSAQITVRTNFTSKISVHSCPADSSMKTNLAVLTAFPVVCFNLTPAASAQQFVSSQKVVSTMSAPIYGVADFNSDGRLDFLTGNTLMLQNSNGTFTPKQLTSVTSAYEQSVVADLNGDGKTDIVTVNSAPEDDQGQPVGNATLTIYLGNGNATFSVKSPIALAGDILGVWVLVSDVNHDGKPDIVTVSSDQYGDAFLQTFLNAGSGNFTAGPTYGGGLIGGNLFVAADFNGDGIPDLAVKNNFELQILTGNGDGSFTPGATYNMNPVAVGVGDFNKDNHPDLVVATPQSGTILLGQGNGTFTTGATLNTEFFTNVSSSQTASFDQVVPANVYVGDLNKDGKLDIAITLQSDTAVVATYFGNGNGTFGNPKAFNVGGAWGTVSSTFADFNKDGNLDVLTIASATGVAAIAQGDGTGGFKAPVISQTPNSASIVTADFNGDGIDDIAVVNEPLCTTCTTTSVTVFLATGKNYFQAPVTYTIPVNRGMIAAGDINNDGRIDLVVARNPQLINNHYTNGTSNSYDDIAVLLGRGDGTFETAVGYHLLGAPTAGTLNSQVYLVDVNKDGKLDLIGDWGVALGKGNGQFGPPIALPSTISDIVALAPGDFNNTGTIGLAVATNTYNATLLSYTSPGNLYVLAGYSNGSFHVVNQKSLPAYATALITADLNDDHRTDILYTTISGYGGPTPQLTLMVELSVTGNYGFSSTNYAIAAPPINTNSTLLTGDFNRDGKMDVAIPGLFLNAGDLVLLPGTGGGALNNSPQYYQGSINQAVVLDVNGDGAPDIVGTTVIGVTRLLNAQ